MIDYVITGLLILIIIILWGELKTLDEEAIKNTEFKKLSKAIYKLECADEIKTSIGMKPLWTPENVALLNEVNRIISEIYARFIIKK